MGLFGDIFGGQVKVPDFRKIDIGEEQKKNIQDNLANFDDAAKLTAKVNQEAQAQRIDQLEQLAPGLKGRLKKQSELISSQLRGELPDDVVNSIIRNSAERSVAGGFGGSQVSKNLTARDLGLSSLNISQQGFANAQNFLSGANAAGAQLLSPSSQLLSPSQRITFQQRERDSEFNVALSKAESEAGPSAGGRAIGFALGVGSSFLGAGPKGGAQATRISGGGNFNMGGGPGGPGTSGGPGGGIGGAFRKVGGMFASGSTANFNQQLFNKFPGVTPAVAKTGLPSAPTTTGAAGGAGAGSFLNKIPFIGAIFSMFTTPNPNL